MILALFLALTLSSFAAYEPLEYFRDVPPEMERLHRSDIEFLYGLRASKQSEIHRKFFGGPDGRAYEDFLRARVRFIGISDCGNPNSAACAEGIFADSTIWLTKSYMKPSLPQVLRAQIMLHERMHLDLRIEHEDCPADYPLASKIFGPLAKFPSCDKDENGSFGPGVAMLYQVARNCTNCSEKVKADALYYADEYLKHIYQEEARARVSAF